MARGRSYSTAELAEIAVGLRRLLTTIEAGEVSAPPGTVNRIEGAVAALEALAEGRTWQPIIPR
jgi:hypothetical protein